MSTKRNFAIGLVTLTPLVLISACMQEFIAPNKGKVEITVKWPRAKPSYRVAEIPSGTTRVEVTILGEGIPAEKPLHTMITPNGQDNSTDFIEVPIGPKVVEALAFDDQNREVAHGERAIAVLPNQLTPAYVDLIAEPISAPVVSPSPPTAPSPSPSVVITPSSAPTPVPTEAPQPTLVTAAGGSESVPVDDRDPMKARFHYPRALTSDRGSRLIYISDNDNHTIRSYDLSSHSVTTVARLGGSPTSTGGTVGGAATGLALGPDGALYFADAESNEIRKLNLDGSVAVIAGTGRAGADDGPALSATFNGPVSIAFGPVDNYLYVADQLNNRVRRINLKDPQLTVSTLAGTGQGGYKGDTGLAISATVDLPSAVVVSPTGATVFVAEAGGRRIRKIDLGTGIIDTAAGNGVSGTAGEGGPALLANLSLPLALSYDNRGHLYIADGWATHGGGPTVSSLTGSASRILMLSDDGRLIRVVGELKTAYGYSGDGLPTLQAEMNDPSGITFDSDGNMFIADTYNNRLREVKNLFGQPDVAAIAMPVSAATAAAAPTP